MGKRKQRKKYDREPSPRQIKAARILAEKGGSIGKAMREAGYSEVTSHTPKKLTRTRSWKELIDAALPLDDVAELHKELRNAAVIQHYDFPVPEKPKRKKILVPQETGGAIFNDSEEVEEVEYAGTGTPNLSDKEIRTIVESVAGCRLIYIKDTSYARVAYFQAPDNRVRDAALDKAYKLRGNYAAEKLDVTDPYDNMSNSDLARKIAKLRAFLQKKPIPK